MLNPFRTAQLVLSSIRLYLHPDRLENVFSVVSAISTPELFEEMEEHLSSNPQGARAIRDRVRLGRIDLERLSALPEGTLGREFALFLTERGLTPETLTDQAQEVDEYISTHLYETHDIWHVVTNFDTDIEGEIGLQAFYLAQHPWEKLAPITMGVAMFKAALSDEVHPTALLEALVAGWRMGKQAEPLFGLDWAERWEQPLSALRREFDVAPLRPQAPKLLEAVALA